VLLEAFDDDDDDTGINEEERRMSDLQATCQGNEPKEEQLRTVRPLSLEKTMAVGDTHMSRVASDGSNTASW
jgi:hypothetical protein